MGKTGYSLIRGHTRCTKADCQGRGKSYCPNDASHFGNPRFTKSLIFVSYKTKRKLTLKDQSSTRMKKLLLSILIFLPFITSAQGNGDAYYVALNGDDSNPGTFEEPWSTWQKGFESVRAGDTLYIRGGVYMNDLPVMLDPDHYRGPKGGIGTYDHPIVISGYPGEWPILDCSNHCANIPERPYGKRYNSAITIWNTEYIHFKDFEVRNVFQCDSVVDGAITAAYSCNLTFERIVIHDVGQRGFFIQGGVWGPYDGRDPDVPIEPSKWGFGHPDTTRWINCDVYNLCDSLSEDVGNAADAWKTIHYATSYVYWEGCRAWNYTDDGFDPNCVGGVRHFENCWAMPGDKYKNSVGEWEVERNGFKVSGPCSGYDPDMNHLIFKNSVAYDCTHGLILMDSYNTDRTNALVYNNTIFRCGLGIANWEDDEGMRPNTHTFRNTLIYDTWGRNAIGNPYDTYILSDVPYNVSHCTWQWSGEEFQNREPNPAFTVTDDDFNSVDHATIFAQLTAPRKADGSLPAMNALALAPTSDLIDGGTDVGIPWFGLAPDIGAFEYDPDGVIVEIPPETNDSGISVFPNPASDRAWIQTDEPGPCHIRLLDLQGRKVVSRKVNINAHSSYPLSLGTLKPGVYIMEVKMGEKCIREKLVVKGN